jgi:hypothetical protein
MVMSCSPCIKCPRSKAQAVSTAKACTRGHNRFALYVGRIVADLHFGGDDLNAEGTAEQGVDVAANIKRIEGDMDVHKSGFDQALCR